MATLIAVNVGLPREVSWGSRTVHTGVWKEPVTGPRMVRRLNVDGDGQGDLGGHGGEHRAVLVYQLDAYRYWQRELRRDDLTPGAFGENFTVDGLPDDEVCIGDKYRIGEAIFEVTQPRVTCYRVGLRLREPRMAALLVQHHRPGFYLRVLTEGHVQAGDAIVKLASGPEGITVAEIDALLYLPGHARDRIARALRIPALSPGWKVSLQALLERADGDGASGNPGLNVAASVPAPSWQGFRELRVERVVRESASISSFHLATPDGAPLPAALPGQFLTFRLPALDGPALIRSYSMSGPPGAGGYRISVKREPSGAGSRYMHDRVHAGDTLEVAAPRGSFVLRAANTPVLLVSAGVGATPVLAMLHALAAQRATREVWWLHGARDRDEHAFAAEARDILARLPNARVHVCFSRPAASDTLGVDYTSAGRITSELLAGLGLPRDAAAYVCGPAAFMQDVTAGLVAAGVTPSAVHTEIFGAAPSLTPGVRKSDVARAPHPPAAGDGAGPEVSFARSGLTVRWSSDSTTLLELAEACDVPTRWSCRTGVCHNCETALVSGTVTHEPDPVEPPAAGNVLLCCARPRGDVVLDL